MCQSITLPPTSFSATKGASMSLSSDDDDQSSTHNSIMSVHSDDTSHLTIARNKRLGK